MTQILEEIWTTDYTSDWTYYEGANSFGYYSDTELSCPDDSSVTLTMTARVHSLTYGIWDWTWVGFSSDKDTKISSTDDAVWLKFHHRMTHVPGPTHIWFQLQTRVDGTTYSGDLFGIDKTTYIDSVLTYSLTLTSDSFSISVCTSGGEEIASSSIVTVPDISALNSFTIGTLNLGDGIDFTYEKNVSDTVCLENPDVDGGMELDVYSWNINDSVTVTSPYNIRITRLDTDLIILWGIPDWDGEKRSISKDIAVFNFWTDDIDVIDKGMNNEPLHINGTITDTSNIQAIHNAMDDNAEIRITGLGDCYDAVYVIVSFSYSTLKGTATGISWEMKLEYVRD
jgi:hypothetical protein